MEDRGGTRVRRGSGERDKHQCSVLIVCVS